MRTFGRGMGFDQGAQRPALSAPAALFAGSVAGVWFDPSDMSSMFQDAAGTTPSAIDAVVGRINDKSGNGKHATQATTASKPILRQDGARYYLEFDGVDDSLQAGPVDFTGTNKVGIFLAARKLTNTSAMVAELGTTSAAGQFRALAGTTWSAIGRGTAGDAGRQTSALSGANTSILTATHDLSGADADLATNIRRNGATDEAALGATTAPGDRAFINGSLYIGARAGTSLFFNGRIYGLIVVGRMPSVFEIAANETWLNGRTGAY